MSAAPSKQPLPSTSPKLRPRGRLITLEGGDGVGKSTQAGRLAARLEASGHTVRVTREPGGTPFGEAARALLLSPEAPDRVPLADALVFSAARADHVATVIAPALAAGHWVICDRFIDSTRVYQGASGRISGETLQTLERISTGGLLPDLTLILDLASDVGLGRAKARSDGERGAATDKPEADAALDRYESREAAFHKSLRAAFLAIATGEPERCVVIDAGGPVATVEQAIWAAVADRLKP